MADQKHKKFLKTFKALILDGDGVWFTGAEYTGIMSDGTTVIFKSRHHHDGQGLSFLRALGIEILFATSEGEPLKSIVKKLNNLPSVINGTWKPISLLSELQKKGTKVDSIEKWLIDRNLSWADCAYIGDDRTDLEAMNKSGLAVTPSNGQRVIKKVAQLILSKPGGHGAVREFAEMVLDSRGVDEGTLPPA